MTTADLSRILDLAKAHSVAELELVYPGGRLQFRRTDRTVPAQHVIIEAPQPPVAAQSIIPAGTGYEEAMHLAALHERGALHVVRAPSIGRFSSIDEQGVVTLVRGRRVEAGAVLGTLTALGLTRRINAPVAGVIAAAYARHGEPVQYGHLIAAIET
jgi:biotin carboxyl carrier protein